MESKIVDASKKFDSQWDLYDLPDRETCVRNLEALLCTPGAREDVARTIEALYYFQSTQDLPNMKLDGVDSNIKQLSPIMICIT